MPFDLKGKDNMKKASILTAAVILSMTLTACNAKKEEDTRPLGEMRDITASELIAEMDTGWNLGNTLDAEGGETGWGNPTTTKEMIDEVHNAGFNTIRIPTTWDGHTGDAPDFTIDEEWIKRVEEVVDYALEDDMYVILNIHHEDNWLKPQYDGLDDVKAELSTVTTLFLRE